MDPCAPSGPARPSRSPALLLGLGLGGFVDGILLHQLLQWHHMVSDVPGRPATTLAGLQANTVADGAFHAAAWVLVVAGTVAAVRSLRRGRLSGSYRFQGGLLLAGWGLFNVADGVVNHHLLGVHHVRDDLGGPPAWDLGFLATGVLLAGAGWWLHRRGAVAARLRRRRARAVR